MKRGGAHRGEAAEELVVLLGVDELGSASHIKGQEGDAHCRDLRHAQRHVLQGRSEHHQHALLLDRRLRALPVFVCTGRAQLASLHPTSDIL